MNKGNLLWYKRAKIPSYWNIINLGMVPLILLCVGPHYTALFLVIFPSQYTPKCFIPYLSSSLCPEYANF